MVPLGQMMPAAAVSALVFGHNKSCYFNVGKVDKGQIVDYTEHKVRPTTPPASPPGSRLRPYACAVLAG